MKRITLALGLLSAGLAGCMSVDSRVASREDMVNESGQVVSDRESPPEPLPIVVRWQRLMVRIRESRIRIELTSK
jgi:hypothetical protein